MGAMVATGPSTSTIPVMLFIDVVRVALVEVVSSSQVMIKE